MVFVRSLLFIAPVAAGIALVFYAVSNRQAPERILPQEMVTTVRVIAAMPRTFVPRVSGFGAVEPSRTWSAIAQVAGRVDFINPAFVRGGQVNKGAVLIRLAPEEYELAIAQSRANIESAEAQIEEMKLSGTTTNLSLQIEQAALDLAEKELARQTQLVSRGTVSLSVLDDQQAAVLSQRAKLQDLKNKLTLLPSQMKALEQSKSVAEAELKIAQLNLERTVIKAPFDARVAEADAEISQFIAAGAKMGLLDGVEAAEIDVQIPPAQMAGFARLAFGAERPMTGFGALDARDIPLSAVVSLEIDGVGPIWQAGVNRISDTVDPETRSIGVIVSVEKPYEGVKPGERPPLIKGMFAHVELRGPPVDNVILVPRNAVTGGRLKIVDAESRLRFVDVEIAFVFQDAAVLRGGLAAGAKIVISDLSPALDGMLLHAVEDEAARARLDALAQPDTSAPKEAAAR